MHPIAEFIGDQCCELILEIPYGLVEVEDDMCGGEGGVAAEVHLDLAREPPYVVVRVRLRRRPEELHAKRRLRQVVLLRNVQHRFILKEKINFHLLN